MNMYTKMKGKGIPATDVRVSSEIIKTVSEADKVELFRQLDPISAQNKSEYNAGLEYLETHPYYNGVLSVEEDNQQRVLKRL